MNDPARARDVDPVPLTPSIAQGRGENGALLARSAAVTLTLTYASDASGDVDGGVDRGTAYLQRIGIIGDFDFDRLIGWRGASGHVSAHFIVGTGLSARRVGNALTVSGLEAEPAARLFNLWIEQKLGQQASLRVGQFTAAQEFAISPTAALFVNSTFGWPASFATDLPSGGPAYPLAAPGIRVAAKLRDDVTLRLAVFAGDPAGPGSGDPQRRNLHGFNGFGFQGRPFIIGELSRNASGNDPAWSLTLGGWLHTGSFEDLRTVNGGTVPASPTLDRAGTRDGNWSVYGIMDGRLWHSRQRALRGFLRWSASPADRNPGDLYLDAGLSLSAPIESRPMDTIGLGLAVERISSLFRARFLRDRALATDQPLKLPNYEAIIEASWQFRLGATFYLQPNVQLVLHPQAALVAHDTSGRFPPHAVVVGMRSSVRF